MINCIYKIHLLIEGPTYILFLLFPSLLWKNAKNNNEVKLLIRGIGCAQTTINAIILNKLYVNDKQYNDIMPLIIISSHLVQALLMYNAKTKSGLEKTSVATHLGLAFSMFSVKYLKNE
jgi:uncharacterized membrane protein YpjA